MPEYRAPGVYMEEISFRPRTIEGVDTAVAGIVGPTHTGPVRGRPVGIASVTEFEQRYGDASDLHFNGRSVLNHTALAARAFFDNGGGRLFVVRTAAGVCDAAAPPDGEPTAIDYAGTLDPNNGSTGLAALAEVPEIATVLTPAAAAGDAIQHQRVVDAVQRHCERMRHRIGLVDPREEDSVSEVCSVAARHDDARLALYYPWVVTAGPTRRRRTLTLPPSGFLAGIYARNDRRRGVHKAPAGLRVTGALGFSQPIDRTDQARLNPRGVNCLRSLPSRGHVVWGARTLSSDPEWRYISIRRYLNYLERSMATSTDWVAFEPNGEPLWSSLGAAIDAFLHNEWRQGRLQGTKPSDAYFVRCDRSTMTQSDIANGWLVCETGVAPLRPAEFVVLRTRMKIGGA